MKKVVIIGAGFAGLSLACLLAKSGHSVTVIEKNQTPGGRAMTFKDKNFTFDMGPSWYLMPDVFERFFSHFGKKPSDFYLLKRLDPAYRIFFEKGDTADMRSDLKKNITFFNSLEKNGAVKFRKYLSRSEYLYQKSINNFIYQDYNSFKNLLGSNLFISGSWMLLLEKLDSYIDRTFKSDKARKILEYNMLFLGGTPKNTPALYSLMSHIDFNLGVWYPYGGMGKVVNSLTRLGRSLGVKYIFSEQVIRILLERNVAKGVQTHKKKYSAEIVVSGADYHHSETSLLSSSYQSYPESYWRKKTLAPSAFVMYLGLNKKLKNITHHNLFFDANWGEHFDSIFKKPHWPKNPSYYVCVPSVTDMSVAPKNHENVFILVPVAPGLKDNSQIRKNFGEKIISNFETVTGQEIKDSIITKHILSINDYQKIYNSYKGTALGLSHTLLQTAFFRPKHRSKKVRNLFFTGQYTHPGIGVPMALISSEIVLKQIVAEYG